MTKAIHCALCVLTTGSVLVTAGCDPMMHTMYERVELPSAGDATAPELRIQRWGPEHKEHVTYIDIRVGDAEWRVDVYEPDYYHVMMKKKGVLVYDGPLTTRLLGEFRGIGCPAGFGAGAIPEWLAEGFQDKGS